MPETKKAPSPAPRGWHVWARRVLQAGGVGILLSLLIIGAFLPDQPSTAADVAIGFLVTLSFLFLAVGGVLVCVHKLISMDRMVLARRLMVGGIPGAFIVLVSYLAMEPKGHGATSSLFFGIPFLAATLGTALMLTILGQRGRRGGQVAAILVAGLPLALFGYAFVNGPRISADLERRAAAVHPNCDIYFTGMSATFSGESYRLRGSVRNANQAPVTGFEAAVVLEIARIDGGGTVERPLAGAPKLLMGRERVDISFLVGGGLDAIGFAFRSGGQALRVCGRWGRPFNFAQEFREIRLAELR